jgi:hypothetical protein
MLSAAQKCFGNPACLNIAFAVCRLGMPTGTGKFRFVIGLYQISWLPFPCRTGMQPAARRSALSSRSN